MECAQVTEEQKTMDRDPNTESKAQCLAELSRLSLPDTSYYVVQLLDANSASAALHAPRRRARVPLLSINIFTADRWAPHKARHLHRGASTSWSPMLSASCCATCSCLQAATRAGRAASQLPTGGAYTQMPPRLAEGPWRAAALAAGSSDPNATLTLDAVVRTIVPLRAAPSATVAAAAASKHLAACSLATCPRSPLRLSRGRTVAGVRGLGCGSALHPPRTAMARSRTGGGGLRCLAAHYA